MTGALFHMIRKKKSCGLPIPSVAFQPTLAKIALLLVYVYNGHSWRFTCFLFLFSLFLMDAIP
jgi:hypothetical protein